MEVRASPLLESRFAFTNMEKIKMKNIIIGSFIFLLILSSASFIKASDGVSLDIIQGCNIQYAGESCLLELQLTNDTGATLEGALVFSMEYGVEPFDGLGIDVLFEGNTSTDWVDGSVGFPSFSVDEGVSLHDVLIETHSALLSGEYNFTLTVAGEGETESASRGGAVVLCSMGGSTLGTPVVEEVVEREEIEEILRGLLLGEEIKEGIINEISEEVIVVMETEEETEDIVKGWQLDWFRLFLVIWLFWFIVLLIVILFAVYGNSRRNRK